MTLDPDDLDDEFDDLTDDDDEFDDLLGFLAGDFAADADLLGFGPF